MHMFIHAHTQMQHCQEDSRIIYFFLLEHTIKLETTTTHLLFESQYPLSLPFLNLNYQTAVIQYNFNKFKGKRNKKLFMWYNLKDTIKNCFSQFVQYCNGNSIIRASSSAFQRIIKMHIIIKMDPLNGKV